MAYFSKFIIELFVCYLSPTLTFPIVRPHIQLFMIQIDVKVHIFY